VGTGGRREWGLGFFNEEEDEGVMGFENSELVVSVRPLLGACPKCLLSPPKVETAFEKVYTL
jgi:hypothetical protein